MSVVLKLLATKHLSVKGWADIANSYELVATVKDNGDLLVSDALFYLWEGAIPLVTAFCHTYSSLKHSGPSSKMYCRLMKDSQLLEKLELFAESLMV